MAILRAKHADCSIVLVTATPSLESWINVQKGRYQHITLANRYGVATMPDIQTIDLTKFKLAYGKWISEPLLSDMQHRLKSNQQTLLYLNRRGYAPLAVCSECRVKQSCYQCDSLLVTHRLSNQLRCHQCGIARPFQNRCQSCGQIDSIQLVGQGLSVWQRRSISFFQKQELQSYQVIHSLTRHKWHSPSSLLKRARLIL